VLKRLKTMASEQKQTLNGILESLGANQSEEEFALAEETISSISSTFAAWIGDNGRSVVKPVGSRQLGLTMAGSDVDMLCCTEDSTISRSAFFTSFADILRAKPEVTRLRSVPLARVGVIKLSYKNRIHVDLTYANKYGQSPECATSLNGYKVGAAILSIIQAPEEKKDKEERVAASLRKREEKVQKELSGHLHVRDKGRQQHRHQEAFKVTLTAVKVWAKRRQIYGAVLGFLGGVSAAVMVARLFKEKKSAEEAEDALLEFFATYSTWDWTEPVTIRASKNIPPHSLDAMRVMTPSKPIQNTTYNATASSLALMVKEMKRAHYIILRGDGEKWRTLFEPLDFFAEYNHYLVVTATAVTADDQLEWEGLVESKLRHLVAKVEQAEAVTLAHVNPVAGGLGDNRVGCRWFVGLSLSGLSKTLDLTESVKNFVWSVRSAGMERWMNAGMEVGAEYKRRRQIEKESLVRPRDATLSL
jgi:poly(A) polymerase